MNSQPTIRYPATWEANLLAGSLLIFLIVSSGVLTVFFKLPAVLIVGQLLFVVPALVWIAIRRLPLKGVVQLHPISLGTVLWSVVLGLTCWMVVAGMSTLIEQLLAFIGPYPEIPLPKDQLEGAAYMFTFIVLAPLTEEPIYRGLILQAWLRRGIWVGIGVSSLLFGLLHSQIAPLLPLTLFGIVLGVLVQRSQSVLSSIFADASYNAAAVLFVIVPSLQATPDSTFMVAGAIALPITAFLVWFFIKQNPTPSNGMPPQETSSWLWPVITFLVVVSLFGLMAILEIVMRLNPNLKSL